MIKDRPTFLIFEPWFGECFYNFDDFKNKFLTTKSWNYTPQRIILNKYNYIKKSKELMKFYDNIKI